MILNILTVLFFVLGFALLFWMIVERRRDVLHYVTEPSRARATMPDSSGHVTSRQPAADLRARTSLTKLPRIVRYTEGESEMSTAGLQELEELDALGVKLLATARELPPGPDRDNALSVDREISCADRYFAKPSPDSSRSRQTNHISRRLISQ